MPLFQDAYIIQFCPLSEAQGESRKTPATHRDHQQHPWSRLPKPSSASMTDKLPPNLLALFAPRPALRYLPPSDHAQEDRHTNNIGGVAQFLEALKEYEDDYEPTESWLQKRDRKKLEKKEAQQKLVTEGVKDYKPAEDPQVKGDAFKTLFVSRLSYDVDNKDLEREFGRFGPIERVS